VKRTSVCSTAEGWCKRKGWGGPGSVLAHCGGVNYQVYVTYTRLLVGKRFATGEKFMNVPTASINTLELITKCLLPPLTFAVLGAIASFLIWWFPGTRMLPLPVFPYVVAWLAGFVCFVGSLVVAWWRLGIAVLRIRVSDSRDRITVKLVSTSKAEAVFK